MTDAELKQAVEAERRLSERLGEYVDQWIVVRDHQVIAHAEKLSVLTEQIRKKQIADLDEIRHVSSANLGICIL